MTPPAPAPLWAPPTSRVVSEPRWARWANSRNTRTRATAQSASRRAGQNFQLQVGKRLANVFPFALTLEPWIDYEDDQGRGRCSPDFVLDFMTGPIIVGEVKHTHSEQAWWQLRKLYEPLIRIIAVGREVAVLEVAKYASPVRLPEEPEFIFAIEDIERLDPSRFSVLVWPRH